MKRQSPNALAVVLPSLAGALVAAMGGALVAGCGETTSSSAVDAVRGAGGNGGTDGGGGGGRVALPDGGSVAPGTPADGGAPGQPGASGCKGLVFTAGADLAGAKGELVAWSDADCRPRTTSLVRNDAADPFGSHGGYARAFTYVADGKTRNCEGSGGNGWAGFGYIVNHFGNGASQTQGVSGKYRTVLAGANHAIHEFTWRVDAGGPVDVTVHWSFATGRSHPLYSITYDASPAGPDVVKADTRSPYGDIKFDDGKNGQIDGVGWGDKYRFTTTSPGPALLSSSWDYTKPNVVPYDVLWSSSADAEMGLVQTQAWEAHVAGGDYGGNIMGSWGKTGSPMPTDWAWPYQLNQYEMPYVSSSHRLAWGATFGAVGQRSYAAWGKTLSGYPFVSYAVFVVLGKHTTSAVAAQVAEMEAVQTTTLTATRGMVATRGVAGPGRTDTAPFTPAGFDPVYAAWTVDAAGNAATAAFATGPGTLKNPVVVLRGYTSASPPRQVTLGGRNLTANDGYFATVDPAGKRLFLTLNASLSGTSVLTVD
jgi:hypothetical protein